MISIRLAGRTVGPDAPCFVMAEGGVNHNGKIDLAIELIEAAAAAGADAIKFQTFHADRLAASHAPKARYQQQWTSATETQRDMLRELELDEAAYEVLSAHSRQRGIVFCSTPFDLSSADLLDDIGVPFFKVSSGDLTYVPLLRHLGGKGKPVVLSTGMSELSEIHHAVRCLVSAGAQDIALLHCVSEYPAPADQVNLRAMKTMAEHFGRPVGFSDHTLGLEVSLAAVALGAAIIEKHLTISRELPGPDHHASLEPGEFGELVRQIRNVESAMGDGAKRPASSELANRVIVRRSVFASTDIPAGELIEASMLDCKRLGGGIPSSEFDSIVGRRTLRLFRGGEVLVRGGIEWPS